MQWTLSLTLSVCVFDFGSMLVNIYVVYCILSASATEVILHTILYCHIMYHIMSGSVSFIWQIYLLGCQCPFVTECCDDTHIFC